MKKVLWAVCLSALAVPSWAAPDTPSQYVPVQYVPIQYVPAQYAPAPAPSAPAAAEYETAPAARPRNLLSIGAGVVIPMGNMIDEGDLSLKAGGPGGAVELQYLNFLNERLALGVEAGGTVLTEESKDYYGIDAETETNSLYGMLAGRLYFNLGKKNLIYLPFGVGFGEIETDLKISYDSVSGTLSDSDTTLMGYVGLGIELERTQENLLSLEVRYHIAKPKFSKYYDIDANYSYVSVMLKAGGLF